MRLALVILDLDVPVQPPQFSGFTNVAFPIFWVGMRVHSLPDVPTDLADQLSPRIF
jgi:hypothetical protein